MKATSPPPVARHWKAIAFFSCIFDSATGSKVPSITNVPKKNNTAMTLYKIHGFKNY